MRRFSYLVFISLCILAITNTRAEIAVTPTYVPRSQGCEKVRSLVGSMAVGLPFCLADEQNSSGQEVGSSWKLNFSIMPAYMQSFNNEKIAESLFGCDIDCSADKNIVKVQGSEVASRDSKAWLADNLYLGCDYDGSFRFDPSISNVLVDLDLWIDMDGLLDGLYCRFYGPIARTKWRKDFCVNELVASTTSCRAGYFTPAGSEKLLASLADYFEGKSPDSVEGTKFEGLNFAKLINCDESKVGFADLNLILGYNFSRTEKSHVGMYVKCVAPTGGERKAEFAFNPVVGNGNHWELGGGLSAHYMFYADEEHGSFAQWFTDVSVTHVFKNIEERTFDLIGKPNSRYMLAQKFTTPVDDNLSGSTLPDTSSATSLNVTTPIAQFNKEFTPVANLTTTGLRIKNTVQIDWIVLFNCIRGNWNFDIGYNFWLRTCEKILNSRGDTSCRLNEGATLFDESQNNTWALKGDANVYGYATVTGGDLVQNQAVALSASQNDATIHKGTNSASSASNAKLLNSGIDDARFAYAGTNNQRLNYAVSQTNSEANHIKTSVTPIFINFENIDFQPVRGLSHKLFTYLGYTWKQKHEPYLGIGFSAEFGSNKSLNEVTPSSEITFIDSFSDECLTRSLSQWSVWAKIGFSFE